MATAPPLGFLLNHLGDVLRDDTREHLAPFGLSVRDYGLLWQLDTNGPLSQRELGQRHRIDRTTVVAVVDRLEARRLVTRSADPTDRRRHAITLTETGRSLFDDVRPAVEGAEAAFTTSLTPSQRSAMLAALNTILQSSPSS